jgi:hypothetical protein
MHLHVPGKNMHVRTPQYRRKASELVHHARFLIMLHAQKGEQASNLVRGVLPFT